MISPSAVRYAILFPGYFPFLSQGPLIKIRHFRDFKLHDTLRNLSSPTKNITVILPKPGDVVPGSHLCKASTGCSPLTQCSEGGPNVRSMCLLIKSGVDFMSLISTRYQDLIYFQ